MSLAVNVHEIEFVNQPMPLQQPQRPVHSAAIHAGIQLLRLAQKLGCVQVFGRSLHHAKNRAALLGHAYSALGEVGLQSPRDFGLR
jgi:hypothetical protein